MKKNVASQTIAVYAWDTSADTTKTGDAANITAYISKDGAAGVQSNDVNPTELDATNMPGVYVFDLTQAETNANMFVISAKSATANITLAPVQVQTESALAGAGGISFTYTLVSTVGATPIADATTWVTSDIGGDNVLASGVTNSVGVITFLLDAATVYFWRQKSGFNFTNPDTEVVAIGSTTGSGTGTPVSSASLGSDSTLQEIKDAYLDNASYEQNSSVSEAQTFITACKMLLILIPQFASKGGTEQIGMKVDLIQDELDRARQWLNVNGTGTSQPVKYSNFQNFRSAS